MDISWLGHSAFKINAGGVSVLVDPFLTGNPTFAAAGLDVDEVRRGVTHVVLTHGHGDHVGDAVAICKASGAKLAATFELAEYLGTRGAANFVSAGIGGEVDLGGVEVAFVPAMHSSGEVSGDGTVYLGTAAGVVLKFAAEPQHVVYHMGDTAVFSDMALVHEFHRPTIGLVPIGGHYTMGAKHAALACTRYFQFSAVLPCHYGTFGVLAPNADQFVAAMPAGVVRVPKAGEVVRL